jgi:hypothetical protein
MQPITHDSIQIGPRTRHECELRIRELRGRRHPIRKIAGNSFRLTEFLRTVAPRDGREALQ